MNRTVWKVTTDRFKGKIYPCIQFGYTVDNQTFVLENMVTLTQGWLACGSWLEDELAIDEMRK